jgi:hypothetical protein
MFPLKQVREEATVGTAVHPLSDPMTTAPSTNRTNVVATERIREPIVRTSRLPIRTVFRGN